MIKNAYIHIPFCASKCHYCSFVSFCNLNAKGEYLDALKTQINAEYNSCGIVIPPYEDKKVIKLDVGLGNPTYDIEDSSNPPRPLRERAEFQCEDRALEIRVRGNKLNTLYFGGGTPSLLEIDEVKSILDLLNYDEKTEITFEVNPDSVDYEYLSALRALGVNRLSIGTQSFNDEILKQIGRRHSSIQATQAVKSAQKAGFDNISLDFIYGLPNQTIESFEQDLKTAIGLNIQHVSLYGLKIEEDSYFGKNMPENLPDLDTQAEMYFKAIELLTASGFKHYEISNFALNYDYMLNRVQHLSDEQPFDPETISGRRTKNCFESRHNLNYWENNTYYGFGCAASGYANYVRYQNDSDFKKYIQNPLTKISQEELSEQEQLEEAIFLGLRKIVGVNTTKINKQYGIDFDIKYEKILKKYAEFFVKTQNGWALNQKGILISNEILAEFIEL